MSTLTEVARRYTDLARVDEHSLRGRCPLHDDSSEDGTFYVNPVPGVFNCFGCMETGDVIALVMAMEKVSVDEARRLVS